MQIEFISLCILLLYMNSSILTMRQIGDVDTDIIRRITISRFLDSNYIYILYFYNSCIVIVFIIKSNFILTFKICR